MFVNPYAELDEEEEQKALEEKEKEAEDVDKVSFLLTCGWKTLSFVLTHSLFYISG